LVQACVAVANLNRVGSRMVGPDAGEESERDCRFPING
jgi:hypothetical protein